jgi:N-acetyl sugar amidotransferase
MKYCKNCLTTSLRPNSSFNKDGVCISCEYSLKISSDKTHTHLVRLKEKITSLRKEAKMKLNNYDCMVGVSGGKDSTRQALWVRDRLKMNPLLVCCAYPPYQMTDIGAKNLDNLVELGFDIIVATPSPITAAKLSRQSFLDFGNVCKASEMSLFSTVPRLAIEFDIKLIMWGENPALQVGDSSAEGVDPLDGNNLRNINTLVEGGMDWMNSAIDKIYKKNHYAYPSSKDFAKKNINIIYLGAAWDDWSNEQNSAFAASHGLTLRPNEESITGDFSNASMLDEEYTNINMMIKYFKFGFGRATDQVNEEIRKNNITRNEGIKIVKKYDGICSDKIIRSYCKYINISERKFWKITNKWVNKDIFKKTSSRPVPLFQVGIDYD